MLPNGGYTTYMYDNKGQLITISNYSSTGAVLSSYSYTRDLSGNITKVVETAPEGTKTITYSYDTLYQLTNATITESKKDTVTFAYTYDQPGNRTSLTINKTGKDENLPFKELHPTLDKQPFIQNPLTINYTYNNVDQLIQEKATRIKNNQTIYQTTYTYDNNGNTIAKNLVKGKDTYITTYNHDYNNMLKQITYPDGSANIFRNSTDGDKRIYKQDTTGETYYYFDTVSGLDHILIEYDQENNVKTIYSYADRIDEPISRKYKTDDGTWKKEYYLYDGHGDVRQVVDTDGKVVADYTYEPFGLIIDWQGGENLKNTITYTGRERDIDSGFYNHRPRYNDSRLGRFTAPDPILRQPRLPVIFQHPYVYVQNNPVNFTDPTGLRTTVAQHDVGAERFNHRYIVLRPECPSHFTSYRYRFYRLSDGGWEATISGQPVNPMNIPPGNLVSRPNSDRYEEREGETEISLPENKNDTKFIKDLLQGESLYENNLPYCAFPSATNACYNSNSYVRGILRYAGVSNPPDIGGSAPGWDKPIPLGSGGAGGGF